MFRNLFFLAFAGIDDDSESERRIVVDPKILNGSSNVIVEDVEFVAREAGYGKPFCIYNSKWDNHDLNIRTECRHILRQRCGRNNAGQENRLLNGW